MQTIGIQIKKKLAGKAILPYIILTVIAALLCIRCFYSFCWSDESFYLSLVHRFWLGDRPVIDEWSGTQFYAFALLPLYALYIKIVGYNEGIFLFFRLFVVIGNYFMTIYIYRSLKRNSCAILSLIGSLIYLLYTRANILGPSYYSWSLLFFTWAVFLFFNCDKDKPNGIRMFAIGGIMAMAVLALPYLAAAYILAIMLSLSLKSFRQYKKDLLINLAGAGLCAVIYLGFLMAKTGFKELLEYMPYLFGDAEHQSLNPVFSVVLWFGRIANRYKYTIVICFISIILVLIKKLRHKTLDQQSIKRIMVINLILSGINVLVSYNVVGCVNIAIAVFAFISYIVIAYQDKVSRKLFYGIYLPGIIFSIVFHMASNTGLDAMTVGFVLCGIVSPVLVLKGVSNIRWNSVNASRWIWCGVIIVGAAALLQSGWLRFFSVYRDDKLSKLTEVIEQGPAKYLYTTKEHKEQYENIVNTIKNTYEDDTGGTVVFTELVPWAYLCVNSSCGAPSPCRFWGGLDEIRLKEYYKLMPDKFPEYILAVAPEYGRCRSVLIQGNGVIEKPNERGTSQWLLNEAEKRGYDKIETVSGIVYKK